MYRIIVLFWKKINEMQLRTKREESLKKIQKQNEEIKALENVILDTGLRLESVTKENEIFEHVAIKLVVFVIFVDSETFF